MQACSAVRNFLMTKGIIALDADGVLLDYGLAYASAWQKAFGTYPGERDPLAYWPIDRWEVERVEGDRLDLLRRAFDNEFWSSIPPVPGAIEACHKLAARATNWYASRPCLRNSGQLASTT